MILSTIAKAVREQNYYAVALEFVIVIAGVVIGFQIQAWAEKQGERAREAAYLERLHAEILELETTRARRVSSRQEYNEHLAEVSDMLDGISDLQPSQEHCDAIGMTFVASNPTTQLAVLNELLSVGGLDLIQSSELRAAVSNYMLAIQRYEDANTWSESITTVLHDRFPELLRAESFRGPGGRGLILARFECDFDAMYADPVFRNALTTNAFAYSSHSVQNIRVDERLQHLHDAVDQVLGVSEHAAEEE